MLNGSGTFSYQWQSSPNGSNPWTNIAVNGTNATYSPLTNVTGTTYYRVSVTDAASGCDDPVSTAVQLVVQPQPTVTISLDNPVVCVTGSALITSSVLNGSGNITYQWQSSPNGSNPWTNIIANGNNATYVPLTNLAGTTYYRVSVTDSGSGCNDPVSASVQLIVQPQPTVAISVNNPVICVRGSATISSVVSNGSDYLIINRVQVERSMDGHSCEWNGATYDVPSAISGSFLQGNRYRRCQWM